MTDAEMSFFSSRADIVLPLDDEGKRSHQAGKLNTLL
jgi:hypothetical protein